MFCWMVWQLIALELQPPQCNELPEGLRQRGQKLLLTTRRISGCSLLQYSAIFTMLVEVDIGASSVPPSCPSSSVTAKFFMPPPHSCRVVSLACSARCFFIASARIMTVTGTGCSAANPFKLHSSRKGVQ